SVTRALNLKLIRFGTTRAHVLLPLFSRYTRTVSKTEKMEHAKYTISGLLHTFNRSEMRLSTRISCFDSRLLFVCCCVFYERYFVHVSERYFYRQNTQKPLSGGAPSLASRAFLSGFLRTKRSQIARTALCARDAL